MSSRTLISGSSLLLDVPWVVGKLEVPVKNKNFQAYLVFLCFSILSVVPSI